MRNLVFLLFFAFNISYSQVVPQNMSHRGTAYNSSGIVLTNTDIGLKVSILDASTSGTVVFSETHNVHTNANGQYNIAIGGGSATSGSFNTIDWSQTIKYLKIEVDGPLVNGINYTVSGSSQLMSVPYALYSQSTVNNNGIDIVSNINNMLTNITPIDNKLVYVKGYFSEGDGGEGFFIFKKNNQSNPNLGTIFNSTVVQSDGTITGRWIRQYSGYMNVEYFGVQRDYDLPYSGFSNSDRIQAMIDYATKDINDIYNKDLDKTIFFPNGQYFIDKPIILKDRVKLLGSSSTLLTNKGDNYDYMFKLDSGPVTKIKMENFIINPNEQFNVGGILLNASFPSGGTQHGGLWDANFKNINIINSKGNCIYLEGGELPYSNYNLPNQFIIFENIRTQRSSTDAYALKITGQNANYTFINCEFANAPNTFLDGTCILISSLNSGTSLPKLGTNAASFINCGFGIYSRYGAIVQNSENIMFDSCFFEGTDYAFDIRDSNQINIKNCRFANAAGTGSLSSLSHTGNYGNCINTENSFISVENNYVIVSDPNSPLIDNQKFINGIGSNVINAKNNSFQNPKLGFTSGILQTASISSNTIDIWSKKLVYVTAPATYNASTSDIKIIKSDINAGETIFLRANGGTIKFLPFTTLTPVQGGNNIYLNGRTSLSITNGQAATFIKIDNAGGNYPPMYQLVSISN